MLRPLASRRTRSERINKGITLILLGGVAFVAGFTVSEISGSPATRVGVIKAQTAYAPRRAGAIGRVGIEKSTAGGRAVNAPAVVGAVQPPKARYPAVQPALANQAHAENGHPKPEALTRREASPRVGLASFYTVQSCLKEGTSGITASGMPLDDNGLTAASWDYSYGTLLRVENLANGKSVVCVVNDRGPNRKLYRRGVIVDLSRRAFETIAPLSQGVIKVGVEK